MTAIGRKLRALEPEVHHGEVWRCGGHLYLCSDLMSDSEEAENTWELMTQGQFWCDSAGPWPRPTLIYTDPPWGQALANGFRTKAGLDHAEYRWTQVYARIAHLAFWLDIPAWYEGPAADTRDGLLVPAAIRNPLDERPTHRLYRDMTYMKNNRGGVYYASPQPAPDLSLGKTHGFAVVEQVLACYPPGVLLDPCSGLGGIALEGEKQGWMSVNNELNPGRMARALARITDLTGAKPERIA